MTDNDDTPTLTITRAQYDEFVESAEDHTILWTTTLALIGVTVGDVPDVDVIEELKAEIARLRKEQADEIAAWERLYDTMMDVRFEIQAERNAARAENARLREALNALPDDIGLFRLIREAGRTNHSKARAVHNVLTSAAALAQETQP
jgi:hypothetical protein